MTAGTSTGSIIAAALSMPSFENGQLSDHVPKFWANDIIKIYREDNDKIFDKNSFSIVWLVVICFLMTPLFTYLGYKYGSLRYDNDLKVKQFEVIQNHIAELQQKLNEQDHQTINGSHVKSDKK